MPHLRPFRPGSRVAGLLVMASAVFGCLAVSVARAEDAPSATPAQNPPPAGLRILYSGDSWHRFMPGLMPRVAAAAGITGQSAAWSGKPDEIKELLTGGKIDVMSWGRPGWSDGQFNQTLGDEFATAGLAGNPNFRFYLQMAWKVHDGLGGKKKIETVADRKSVV